MARTNQNRQNYLPSVVSQNIIQQALTDMKQQLIHQINIQTHQILNTLLTNIRAKINQELTLLTQDYKHLMDQLSHTQALYQKMAGEVQHFHQENQHLRSQLEIINSKNYQYLEEMNISKNELYTQKNLTFQHQQQKMEIQKKVIRYQDKIEEYQAEINRLNHMFEKERERTEELEVLLKSLDQNLKDISRKYDQQHWKCEQMSSNISHKDEKIKQLKLIIEQSEYLNSMTPKTREKYNFRISSQENQSLQDNHLEHHQQQRIKLYQSGYPLSSQLLFQISGQHKNDLSKEQKNTVKKPKEIQIKKPNLKKVQKQKPSPIKELYLVKKTQNSAPKKIESEQKQKGQLEIRKRLNTIFTDRVKYRVDFDIKMEGMKCKLTQKEKQCQKLNRLLHARSSDRNNSSFLKKSFQNSRTISKKSQKEIKTTKKQQSQSRIKQQINRSASQNLSETSRKSNSKIIQNFQSFEAQCLGDSNSKSHSKKQDQFQEFGLSPDKMRHHYLNSEIDVEEDISFKMLQKNLDQSAELSNVDIRSRGNDSILDCSLQLHVAQVNTSAYLFKMDQIKEVEENRSPTTPININKHSGDLDALDLDVERDEIKKQTQQNQDFIEQSSEQKPQDVQNLPSKETIQNQICEYQIFYRIQQKQIEKLMEIGCETIKIENIDFQVQTQIQERRSQRFSKQRVFSYQEIPIINKQLQIEHIIGMRIEAMYQKQSRQIQTQLQNILQQLPENEQPNRLISSIIVQNKQTQHQSKLSFTNIDGLTISPFELEKARINICAISKELDYKIEPPTHSNLKYTSFSQVFRFEGNKVQKQSIAINTNQKLLELTAQKISEIMLLPNKKSTKNTQLFFNNRINIRQASSVDLSQKQSQIILDDYQFRLNEQSDQIPYQQYQNIQTKESGDTHYRFSFNLMSPQIPIFEQNQTELNRQINSARTRSSSQEKLQYRQHKEEIDEIVEQKESDSSKNSPVSSYIEIKPEEQNCLQIDTLQYYQKLLDKGSLDVTTKDINKISSYPQTPINSRYNHQKYNLNTADSYKTSIFQLTSQEKHEYQVISQSEYEQQVIKSYFFDLKLYQQVNEVNIQTQTDIKDIFSQTNNMFVLSSEKNKNKSKFVLWKGKIIHIDNLGNRVSFMQMSNMKQLKTKPKSNNLILGNSEFTLIGNKLTINQKNKTKRFKGQMPEGEWRVSTVTSYKTQTIK